MNVPRTLLLSLLLLLPSERDLSACCVPSVPAEALGESDAVFRGRVLSLRPRHAAEPADVLLAREMPERRRDPGEALADFEVTAAWKGVREGVVTLRGGDPRLSGSVSFEVGEEYVVFAMRGDDGIWLAQECAGTAPIARSGGTLAALGAPLISGDSSLAVLLDEVTSLHPELRIRACRGLALRPESASQSVPLIARCLASDREVTERRAAMQALGALGPEAVAAVPALVAQVASADPELGAEAALVLGRVGLASEAVCEALVACLHDEAAVRAVELALERLPVEREAELPELERRRDAFDWRRGRALEALGRLGPCAAACAASEVLDALILGRVGAEAWPTLVAMGHGEQAAARVVQLLDETPDSRRALAILEEMGPAAPPAAVPLLLGRIRASSPGDSHQAIRVLRAMGPAAAAAVPALITALDTMPVSESDVIQALAAMDDPRSAPVLARAALSSDSPEVADFARRALGAMGLDPSRITPAPGKAHGWDPHGVRGAEAFRNGLVPLSAPALDGVPRLASVTGFAIPGIGACPALSPHPDGLLIADSCADGRAVLHDITTGTTSSFAVPESAAVDEELRDFGSDIAFAGGMVLVGAPRHGGPVVECGAVFAFARDGSNGVLIESPVPTRGGAFGGEFATGGGRVAARLEPRSDAPSGSFSLLDAGGPIRVVDVPAGAAVGGSMVMLGSLIAFQGPSSDEVPGSVFLLDTESGDVTRVLQAPAPAPGDRFGRLLAPIGADALAVAARDVLHVFDVRTGGLESTIPSPGALGSDFPRAITPIDARRFAASAGALGGSVIVFDRSGAALAVATSPAPRMFADFGAFGERLSFAQGRLVATIARIDAASFIRAFREGDRSVGAVSMGEDLAFLAYELDRDPEAAP